MRSPFDPGHGLQGFWRSTCLKLACRRVFLCLRGPTVATASVFGDLSAGLPRIGYSIAYSQGERGTDSPLVLQSADQPGFSLVDKRANMRQSGCVDLGAWTRGEPATVGVLCPGVESL